MSKDYFIDDLKKSVGEAFFNTVKNDEHLSGGITWKQLKNVDALGNIILEGGFLDSYPQNAKVLVRNR